MPTAYKLSSSLALLAFFHYGYAHEEISNSQKTLDSVRSDSFGLANGINSYKAALNHLAHKSMSSSDDNQQHEGSKVTLGLEKRKKSKKSKPKSTKPVIRVVKPSAIVSNPIRTHGTPSKTNTNIDRLEPSTMIAPNASPQPVAIIAPNASPQPVAIISPNASPQPVAIIAPNEESTPQPAAHTSVKPFLVVPPDQPPIFSNGLSLVPSVILGGLVLLL